MSLSSRQTPLLPPLTLASGMPSKSRSIWRSDKAQHFTLVHRSQQDPLAYDAESSSRVLKPTARKNQQQLRQGQTREELEEELGDYAKKQRANVGEAAQYGIFYDDTEYDYMQHLRAVGDDYNRRRGGVDEEDDTEVIMLEAPKAPQGKTKGKTREIETGVQLKEDIEDRKGKERAILQLPAEVLPSKQMMPRNFEEQMEKGLRPDMDPHLRQVLEALEDDAFLMRTAKGDRQEAEVEEDLDVFDKEEVDEEEDIDDFFNGIVQDGELEGGEEPEWRLLPPEGEEGIWEDQGSKAARELMQLKSQGGGLEDLSLESRVALFKKAQEEQSKVEKKRVASSTGSQSIFGEKGASRRSRHPGAKARLAASFYAPSVDGGSTAFSMSSSAMERNQGLTGLDEQFDRMEKIYEQNSDDEEDDEDQEPAEIPNLDAIFDDFLNKNEIVGNKLRERLGDRETTSVEKVDILRRELGDVRVVDRYSIDEVDDGRESYDKIILDDLKSRAQIRQEWDVETVLTTKTNVENHPRTIASTTSHLPRSIAAGSVLGAGSLAQSSNRMPRVRINHRTGVAEIAGYIDLDEKRQKGQEQGGEVDSDGEDEEQDSEAESDATDTPQNVTVTRNRNESKEEKKARKQAVKEQRRSVRQSKSARKQTFDMEMHKQKRALGAPHSQSVAVRLS
jgi:protein LTV1